MQTRDEVESLYNCSEFSQPLECLYQAMQTQEIKFSSCLNFAFLEKYCYFVVYKQFICR